VFVGFLDYSKAFDQVSYWKLLHKLLDDNVDCGCWYSNQQACVQWRGCMSDCFRIGNGTRQGGVISP